MTRYWLRIEARRRWRALAVFALLVALASATVFAAVAGARRGMSAVTRLEAVTAPTTIVVLTDEPGFDWTRVRALPEVAALAEMPVAGFAADGHLVWGNGFPTVGADVFHTIERPVVLAGRLPDPRRADEVVVTARYPAQFGKDVGDTVTIRLASPEQLADPSFDPHTATDYRGPRIAAKIVGVIRSPWYSDAPGADASIVPSPALAAQYLPNLIGPGGFLNALVRLHGGAAGIPAFRADLIRLTGRSDIGLWSIEDKFTLPARKVTRFDGLALLAFAGAAATASLVLLGQALARHVRLTVSELRVLTASGLARRSAAHAAAVAPTCSATVGVTVGVAAAYAASRWLPFGVAADLEPSPGPSFDATVLVGGWIVGTVLVAAGSFGIALAASSAAERGGRRSAVAGLAARLGLPVPVVMGIRFALEPGRGRTAVPVRSALYAAVAGVLGATAAITFASGAVDAATHPSRFGRVHQVEAMVGLNGDEPPDVGQAIAGIRALPGVAALDDTRVGVAQAGKTTVTTYTWTPTAFPIVLVSGRAPADPADIVLAPGIARALQVGPGDRVTVVGGSRPVRMTVTGLGFAPEGPHNGYDEGGWITPAGHDRLYAEAPHPYLYREVLVQVGPHADPQHTAAAITAAVPGSSFGPATPIAEIDEIHDVERLPVLLAGFLALLALGAVGHALAGAVRRRGSEVAVLRAVGMTRRQAGRAVGAQAWVLVLIGLAFGVPSGVAVGRVLWHAVAVMMPLAYVPPAMTVPLLLIGPVALLAATALAVWPRRILARTSLARALRAE